MKNPVTIIIGLAVLLAAPAGQARAQDAAAADAAPALQLTLDAAVQRAIEHNPELAIVRLGTEVESTRVGEARTAYTPELLTTVARSNLGAPPTNYFLGNQGTVTRDLFSSAGVRQRVPWGNGTWSLSWDASRTTSNSPLNSFEPAVQSGLQLAFSQPLVRDRKIDSASQQLIISKRNQQSSELQFRESAVQTVATVKQAYWTLKALRANVTVQQQSLALAEQLAKENGVRVQLGQAPPLDLVQVQSEVADRRGTLIRAEAAAADGEDVLRRLIMDPSDGSFWNVHLDPIDEPTRRASLPDVEAVVAQAMNQRYDVARAMNDVSNAASNVEFLEPEIARRAAGDVVSRQRAGRFTAAPDGDLPGHSRRTHRLGLRRRARPGALF